MLGPASPSTQHLSSGGYALEEVEAGWHPNIARPLEKWEYHSEREIYIYIIEYIILYFIYTGNMMAIQWINHQIFGCVQEWEIQPMYSNLNAKIMINHGTGYTLFRRTPKKGPIYKSNTILDVR